MLYKVLYIVKYNGDIVVRMKKQMYLWICAVVLLTIVFGTVYVTVQQAQRNDADYPQIQMAEDTAAALNRGVPPSMLLGSSVQMDTSLAPLIIIYNMDGNPVGGTGYLHGEVPKIPKGVLVASREHEYHRVTWQPTGDVRIAAVAVPAHTYYVVGGRSMKQIERNERRSLALVSFGGVASLACVSLAFAAYKPLTAKDGKKS